MKNFTRSLLAAVTALAVTSSLSAQTLADVILDPSISLMSNNFSLFYDADTETLFDTGNVSASTGLGSLVTTSDFIDLFAVIDSAGSPLFDPFADDDFQILDGESFVTLLSGDLLDSSFEGSQSQPIQLLFEVTGGDLATDFGDYVVISLSSFTDAASLTAPTDLPNGFDTTPTSLVATLEVTSAVIPEPNANVIVASLSVVAGLALRRRL